MTWFSCPRDLPLALKRTNFFKGSSEKTFSSPVSGALLSTHYPGWLSYDRLSRTQKPPPNSPGLIPTFPLNKPPSRRPHVAVGPQVPQSAELRVGSGVCVASLNLPRRKPKVKKTAASPSTAAQKQRWRYQGTGVGSVSWRRSHISARGGGASWDLLLRCGPTAGQRLPPATAARIHSQPRRLVSPP